MVTSVPPVRRSRTAPDEDVAPSDSDAKQIDQRKADDTIPKGRLSSDRPRFIADIVLLLLVASFVILWILPGFIPRLKERDEEIIASYQSAQEIPLLETEETSETWNYDLSLPSVRVTINASPYVRVDPPPPGRIRVHYSDEDEPRIVDPRIEKWVLEDLRIDEDGLALFMRTRDYGKDYTLIHRYNLVERRLDRETTCILEDLASTPSALSGSGT